MVSCGSTRLCMVGYGVTPILSLLSRGKVVSSNPGKFNLRTKSLALKCLEHNPALFRRLPFGSLLLHKIYPTFPSLYCPGPYIAIKRYWVKCDLISSIWIVGATIYYTSRRHFVAHNIQTPTKHNRKL